MPEFRDLPPAPPKPCDDCPWRRVATPGWLGPHTAIEWVAIAHGEQPVACHRTIRVESWDDEGVRQCKGLAIYRNNVYKLPHNPNDATHSSEEDRATVFGRDSEFLDYHQPHEGRSQ